MIAVLDPASCLDEKYFGLFDFVFALVGSYLIYGLSPFLFFFFIACPPLQKKHADDSARATGCKKLLFS